MKYAAKKEREKQLVDALIKTPNDSSLFEELCRSLRPFMFYVYNGQKNYIPYMTEEDYLLEFDVEIWKAIKLFSNKPEVYDSVRENDNVTNYLLTTIRNRHLRIFRDYVKKSAVLISSTEMHRCGDYRCNRYVFFDYLIELWKQKHREYNHAHDNERKAYYQAHREHYRDYNHKYYMAHRDEIRRRQAERRQRIKLEKELRHELLCRLVNILSNL